MGGLWGAAVEAYSIESQVYSRTQKCAGALPHFLKDGGKVRIQITMIGKQQFIANVVAGR